MPAPRSHIQAEFDEPILFRTTVKEVYQSTIETGSLWLRSDKYYRELEDQVRNDVLEGANAGTTHIPLRVQTANGMQIDIGGPGHVGQLMIPHYLVSLHGTSIVPTEREAFGGYTFGVRSLMRLSAEILFQCSQQIRCSGYRYGHVYYQYSAFAQSLTSRGGEAMKLGDSPPYYLNPVNTDVLRKRPTIPFIHQDEWRIVIFTEGYLDEDAKEPLKISVSPSHFYPYLEPGA